MCQKEYKNNINYNLLNTDINKRHQVIQDMLESIEPRYLCPITHELVETPVTIRDSEEVYSLESLLNLHEGENQLRKNPCRQDKEFKLKDIKVAREAQTTIHDMLTKTIPCVIKAMEETTSSTPAPTSKATPLEGKTYF